MRYAYGILQLTCSVYRVRQHLCNSGQVIGADQFAAKINALRSAWGERDQVCQRPVPSQPYNWEEHRARDRKGLVLFSGDLYNPSVESSITRGAHMVPVINAMQVDCACLGKYVYYDVFSSPIDRQS